MGFALRRADRRWHGNVVPYVIHDSIRDVPIDLLAVNLALERWNTKTCVSFRPKTEGDVDFAEFIRDPGRCRSATGRQGGKQQIRCNFSTTDSDEVEGKAGFVIHEMGHAVGLLHEHQRRDRDAYVVVSANALKIDSGTFATLPNDDREETVDIIGAYDCLSIMHYGQLNGLIGPHPNGCSVLQTTDATKLTEGDVKTVAYLYGYRRKDDSGDESVNEAKAVAVSNFRLRELVTAIRTDQGNLQLIAWAIDGNGRLLKLGESGTQAGKATHIDIARGLDRFVVAYRTDEDRLRLISWAVTGEGDHREIEPKGDSGDQAGDATLNKIIHLEDQFFVTASRTAERRLKLIGWRLNDDDSIDRLADSGDHAGVVEEISLAAPGAFPVTAVRTANGTLKLIVWDWNRPPAGPSKTIDRLFTSTEDLGEASLIRSIVFDPNDAPGRLAVSFRTGDGNLRLAVWRAGASVTLEGDSGNQAGRITGNAIGVQDADAQRLVSAVKTSEGRLRLIHWQHDRGGVARLGDSGDEGSDVGVFIAVSPAPLRQSPIPPFNSPFIVSCAQRPSGRLELISWSPCGSGPLTHPDTDPTAEVSAEDATIMSAHTH